MKLTRAVAMIALGITVSISLFGCGNKESADSGGTTNTPAKTATAPSSAPPQAQAAIQRGMAQGQADGNAYAQRMKAQAGQAPK